MTDELGTARAAAQEYARRHGLLDPDGVLDDRPLLGPATISGDGDGAVVAYRWLGSGRGSDYVQVEVDRASGTLTVHGARGHDALPPHRP